MSGWPFIGPYGADRVQPHPKGMAVLPAAPAGEPDGAQPWPPPARVAEAALDDVPTLANQ